MKRNDTKGPEKTNQNFPVVGIAASAGGLDAIKKLVSAISLNSGMAYVIVQHLSPEHPSKLQGLLSEQTKVPVYEIINEINLAPNHIYIIPENNNLITNDGVLKLQQRTRGEKMNIVIDIFFESLAEVHKSFAIGIILSGTAFDGTFGFKKIKDAGGTTLVQDPDTAEFKGMPQSAVDAGIVDYVLSPENMPAKLLEIYKSYTASYAFSNEEQQLPQSEEEILFQIINLVFIRTGNDFRHYKQPTLRRRIARRMVINRKETLQDYYHYLRNDKKEQELLFNDFLIPVTYFFRDQHFFEALNTVAFPQLIRNTPGKNLRVWVAGCATGEEAYSLAIVLDEYLTERNSDIKVQIFASDVSEKYISKARTAIYTAQDVQQVSQERLQRYFTKIDGLYHVNKVIRDMCIFAVHNFIKDPPFARMDLVSCRNVLIYFNAFLQNKVLNSFHYALKENGILLLGKSEGINSVKNLFEVIEKPEKIYRRKFASGNYTAQPFQSLNFANSDEVVDIETITNKNKTTSEDFTKMSLSKEDNKVKNSNNDQFRIKELENELAQMREDIKRITEEHQIALEELQTTNEELLSSSEELQTMNEELETSTEELQSNNEELLCVNDELIDRQEQLISMRNYSESIVKTIREPLLIIDRDFFVKSANPAFYKYFDTNEKETEGHSLFEIGDCQWDIPEFKELMFKMLIDKEVVHDFKVDTICSGIGKKIMLVNARRILNSQPSGMILLAIEDITDLVHTNELLAKKNAELQSYNEQLETFSTTASHDLQEPLRKIQMFSRRILDNEKNLKESSIHDLNRILAGAGNMSQLVTDLINYSRINFLEKQYKKTDLNVLLKKTISDLKDFIVEKNALITVLPLPQLKIIPHQMQQLFVNLIMNSIKYTKKEVIPQIKIEAHQTSQDEIIEIGGNPEINYSKICVSDNGIGFGNEFENKIFEPFYRLHGNDQYRGSGLGLTLAKKIVSNHHGFITASSKINQGTVFCIYLPI